MSNPFGPGQPGGPGDQNQYGQQPPQYGGQQPYPQQPPQQPYGGQPPYPQQPGQQPYPQQPYPGAAPMGYFEPRRRKKWPWILGGVIGLVVVLGVIGYIVGKDSATNAKSGDCITAAKDPKIIDCGKTGAAFRVIENFKDTRDSSKCDTEEIRAKGAVFSVEWKGGDKAVLCLTITKNTKPSDFDKFQGTETVTQEELDAVRDQLAEAGVEGVK